MESGSARGLPAPRKRRIAREPRQHPAWTGLLTAVSDKHTRSVYADIVTGRVVVTGDYRAPAAEVLLLVHASTRSASVTAAALASMR